MKKIFLLLLPVLGINLIVQGDPLKTCNGSDNHPGITGTIKYHRAIQYEGLKSRDIIVWLPPGYTSEPSKHYPVLYMHDGQNIIDPNTSYAGVEWRLDEICDSLINKGLIEPLIIVGIYNTHDRMEEYTPGEKGERYMKFIVKKLKPFIDKTYRTLPGRKHTMVGGSSGGGIISFMLAWKYSKVFSKAICMSPALKFEIHGYKMDFVKVVNEYRGRKKDIVLYIDNGGIDLDSQLQPGIDEMLKALEVKGYKLGHDYYWIKDPKAIHNEKAWSIRFPDAIKLINPKLKE